MAVTPATQTFDSIYNVRSDVVMRFVKSSSITVNGTTSWIADYALDDDYIVVGLEAIKTEGPMPANQTDLLTVTAQSIDGTDASGSVATQLGHLSLTSLVAHTTSVGTKRIAGVLAGSDVDSGGEVIRADKRIRIVVTATRATSSFNPSCMVLLSLIRYDNTMGLVVVD